MSSIERPHPSLVALHWGMALLLLVAVAAILGRGALPNGHAWRPMLKATHLVAGQLVLLLVVVRAVLRWRYPPKPLPSVSLWARRAGIAVHLLLYGVMFSQPLTGILFVQAGDKDVMFFGTALPRLVASNTDLHFQLKEAHTWIGTAFYGLLGMHVSAALWHHFVGRNDTLRRMWPVWPGSARGAGMRGDSAPHEMINSATSTLQ